MRDYTYRVWFTTGITQTVTCFSANEAAILACAEEIKAGRRYDYNKIERQNDDGSWWDIHKPFVTKRAAQPHTEGGVGE